MARYPLGEILAKIRSVVGVFSVTELQDRVVRVVQDIFGAEACSLYLVDEGRERLVMTAALGYSAKFANVATAPLIPRDQVVECPKRDQDRLGVTGWIASTGRPYMSNSAAEHKNHPHWRGVFDIEQFGPQKSVHNFYGVPLKVAEDQVIGVLKVEGKRSNGEFEPFRESDAYVFDILAGYIAMALSQARHLEKVQRQSEQLQTITNALQRVVGILSEERPMQYLLDEIVATTASILSAEACVLFLKDEVQDALIERAGVGYVDHLIGEARYPLIPKGKLVARPERREDRVGLTAWIAITGEPYLARNNDELRAHPHWRGQYDPEHYPEGSGKQCNSFLGVPLLVADEVVGVLKVENKRIEREYVSFTEQDRQVFETFARSIAIAVGTVQKQRVEREQAITDAMYHISQALAGRFELEPLLAQIVEVGKEIFDAEACVVFLVDQHDPTRLIETKGEGYVKHLEGRAEYRLIQRTELIERPERREDRVGLTAWIAITGQPFLARDNDELQMHPHWRGRYDDEHYPAGSGKQCQSFLGLPLRVGDQVLGVLKVENKKVSGEYAPFDERDQHVFQLLANSASIAIRNARDFERLQEAQGLAAIGTSAAAMAHRMRSPLQTIRLTAELLAEDLKELEQTTEQHLSDLDDVIRGVEQMDDAIQRVRRAAKPLQPALATHDIRRIVQNSFTGNRSFKQQFQQRNIRTRAAGLRSVQQPLVECDRNLLEEAISNLVDNALETVADGGRIEIHLIEKNGAIWIEVIDDGPGITREAQAGLFEPFKKTTKRGGLGLGLYIVRRNIEAHGGTVSYEQQAKGSCFRLMLPRRRAAEVGHD